MKRNDGAWFEVGADSGDVPADHAGKIVQQLHGEPAEASAARGELKSRINDLDMEHRDAFPEAKRAWVLEKIMSLAPLQTEAHTENHHYEKTLLRLHDEGFDLIDLQPQETAFTSVWYRKGRLALRVARPNAAMLVWVASEAGDSTTLMMWRV